MRTSENRRGGRTSLLALGLTAAIYLLGSLFGSAPVTGQDSESWKLNEGGADGGADSGLPGGVPTPAPAATSDSPTPKPPPTSTPIPPPTPVPTLDPKGFKTANEYACKSVGTGAALDPVTGESAADKARRIWQSTQTDRKAKGGRPVPPPYSVPPYPAGATPYMKQCADAGVPLPPPWGDDRWVKQGNLPPDKTFASSAPTTEVWTYKSAKPDGICYALPRIDGTPPTIQLLGQICQGKNSGKACFWDNIDGKTPLVPDPDPANAGKMIPNRVPVTNSSGPTNMAGADTLVLDEGEQCTSCHRGENVFLIHPNTTGPTDKPDNNIQSPTTDPCSKDGPGDMAPDDRLTDTAKKPKFYEPIAPNFTNPKNEPIKPPLKNECSSGCHQIPTLTKGYCGTVLAGFILKEMPPPDGKKSPDEQKGADELIARCRALP